MVFMVYLLRSQRKDGLVVLGHNTVLAVCTTKEIAEATAAYFAGKGTIVKIEEWHTNVTYPQHQ